MLHPGEAVPFPGHAPGPAFDVAEYTVLLEASYPLLGLLLDVPVILTLTV